MPCGRPWLLLAVVLFPEYRCQEPVCQWAGREFSGDRGDKDAVPCSWNIDGAFSIAMTFRVDEARVGVRFFWADTDDGMNNNIIYIAHQNNGLKFFISRSDNSKLHIVRELPVVLGETTKFLWTSDAAGYWKVYLEGNLVFETANGQVPKDRDRVLRIGKGASSDDFLKGAVYDVRIWDSVVTVESSKYWPSLDTTDNIMMTSPADNLVASSADTSSGSPQNTALPAETSSSGATVVGDQGVTTGAIGTDGNLPLVTSTNSGWTTSSDVVGVTTSRGGPSITVLEETTHFSGNVMETTHFSGSTAQGTQGDATTFVQTTDMTPMTSAYGSDLTTSARAVLHSATSELNGATTTHLNGGSGDIGTISGDSYTTSGASDTTSKGIAATTTIAQPTSNTRTDDVSPGSSSVPGSGPVAADAVTTSFSTAGAMAKVATQLPANTLPNSLEPRAEDAITAVETSVTGLFTADAVTTSFSSANALEPHAGDATGVVAVWPLSTTELNDSRLGATAVTTVGVATTRTTRIGSPSSMATSTTSTGPHHRTGHTTGPPSSVATATTEQASDLAFATKLAMLEADMQAHGVPLAQRLWGESGLAGTSLSVGHSLGGRMMLSLTKLPPAAPTGASPTPANEGTPNGTTFGAPSTTDSGFASADIPPPVLVQVGQPKVVLSASSEAMHVTVPEAVITQFEDEANLALRVVTLDKFSIEQLFGKRGDRDGESATFLDLTAGADQLNATSFLEPVHFSLPLAPQLGLVCAYWDKQKSQWSTDGVVTSAGSGSDSRLSCSTTHFSLFGAIWQGFVDTYACSQVGLLSAEAIGGLLDFSSEWYLGPGALTFMSLIALGFATFGVGAFVDHRREQRFTWTDESFLLQEEAQIDDRGKLEQPPPPEEPVHPLVSLDDFRPGRQSLIAMTLAGCVAACREACMWIRDSSALRDAIDDICSNWFVAFSEVRSFSEGIWEGMDVYAFAVSAGRIKALGFKFMTRLILSSSRRRTGVAIGVSDEVVDFVLSDEDLRAFLVERNLQPAGTSPVLPSPKAWQTATSLADKWSLLHLAIDQEFQTQIFRRSGRIGLRGIWDLFLVHQPFGAALLHSVLTSCKLRLLLVICDTAGALLLTTVFFEASGVSIGKRKGGLSSGDSCATSDEVGSSVGRVIAVALSSSLLAGIPVAVLESIHTRGLKKLGPKGSPSWQKQMRIWRTKDRIIYTSASLYILFSSFFVLIFMANAVEEDQMEWMKAVGLLFLLDHICLPLGISLCTQGITVGLMLIHTTFRKMERSHILREVHIALHEETNIMLPIVSI